LGDNKAIPVILYINLKLISWKVQAGPWLEMEGWGVLLLILPTKGRGFGCGFCFVP